MFSFFVNFYKALFFNFDMVIYEPAEDSFLLREFVLKYANGKVLDMGTGSGIQAEAALTKTNDVTAADINKEAIDFCTKKGIKALQSDLFEKINGKFDLIIFNPPYLPLERDYFGVKLSEEDFNYVNDVSLVGGKKGWETIDRFLKQAKGFLNENGRILISFSSLSGDVVSMFKKYRYDSEKLAEKRIFFEVLYVYLLSYSPSNSSKSFKESSK